MGMIKNMWRGFRGGPDFTDTNNFNASFEDIQFSATVPYTNISSTEKPRAVQFPFLKTGWFEKHSKQSRQHHYAPIYTQMWGYVPATMYLPNGELGVLSLSIQIKKVPKDKNISAFELDDLGKHLIAEYEDHYNSPIIGGIGGQGLGMNTEIRQRVLEQSNKRSEPFTKERLKKETDLEMASFGCAPLSSHEIKSIKGRQWVFYIENQKPHRHSKDRMYCMPLSDDFYLCMNFRYRVDLQVKFKVWQKHAEAAEQRIMESVQLTFPKDELALPSSI